MATARKVESTPVVNGLNWTREAAQKAFINNELISVGKNKTNVSKRYFAGAKRAFTNSTCEERDRIYILLPNYRITGLFDDVVEALRQGGVGDDEIQEAVNFAITKDNYEEPQNLQAAEEEKQRRQETKKDVVSEACQLTFDDLILLASTISNTKTRGSVVISHKSGQKEQKLGRSPVRNAATLFDKVKNARASGRVIDVSRMDVTTGKGAVLAKQPTSTRSKKFGTTNTNIISNDLSRFVAALKLAYGEDAEVEYAADIEQVRRNIEESKLSVKKSPKLQSKVFSPKKVPSPVKSPLKTYSRNSSPRQLSPKPAQSLGTGLKLTKIPSVQSPVRSVGSKLGGISSMPKF